LGNQIHTRPLVGLIDLDWLDWKNEVKHAQTSGIKQLRMIMVVLGADLPGLTRAFKEIL
jgi:hypothetical protein